MTDADAVVLGSGPNGLVAAALLARKGWRVTVLEQAEVAGGAIRSESLTVPGYIHDTFSAFYGLLHCSPVFRELGLDRRVKWASFAKPVGAAASAEGAAVCWLDAERTAEGLARCHSADGAAWRELVAWWTRVGPALMGTLLGPVPSLGPSARLLATLRPRGALELVRLLLQPVGVAARERFVAPAAQVLLAGGTIHTDLGADQAGSTPGALLLAMVAQQVGMPVPAGGAGQLAEALVDVVQEAGGSVVTGESVTRVVVEAGRAVGVETATGLSLRVGRAVLAGLGPVSLFRDLVGEERLPAAFLAGLRRFRYGSGIFKVDLALDASVPWLAEALHGCGVVHITGRLDAMAGAASEVRRGLLPTEPLLVVGQQSCADPSRAPEGGHTLWIETHVPSVPAGGWTAVASGFLDRVIDRVEQHAPGLGSRIVGLSVRTPVDLETENPNLVGGDLGGGSIALDQQLVFRPVPGWFRYATPIRGLYLCSASAHPGGGVHGMVGRNCVRRVLSDARIRRI